MSEVKIQIGIESAAEEIKALGEIANATALALKEFKAQTWSLKDAKYRRQNHAEDMRRAFGLDGICANRNGRGKGKYEIIKNFANGST